MRDYRNRVYTFYRNVEVELSQNDDRSYHLISRNGIKPDENFQLYHLGQGIYTKDVPESEVTNAFSVATYANFKGCTWQVDRQEGTTLRLSTSTDPKLPEVKLIDRGWYELWVNKTDIEKLWEERKEAWYGLPYPESVPRHFEIDIASI